MIERIKKFVTFVLTPLLFVAGFIYYLITKKQSLESEVTKLKSQGKIKDLIHEKEKAKEKADEAVTDYKSTRDKYLSEHGTGGDDVS